MASKRSGAPTGSGSGEPASKKSFLLSDPVNLGPVSTEEELDKKVLKFQNAKLYAKLEEKNSQEEEFKARFNKLTRLRDNDRDIISSMNVAWNQLDEDVTTLLRRFGDIPEDTTTGMSDSTVGFLEKLSNRTSKGMNEEIQKRVNYSGSIIKKLVKTIEKVLQRSLELSKVYYEKKEQVEKFKKNKQERSTEDGHKEDYLKEEEENALDMTSIELAIRQDNAMLKTENKQLHDSLNALQDKYEGMPAELAEVKDKLATAQKENSELHAKQEDMQYDLQKATKQFEKLIKKLNETHVQNMSGGQPSTASKIQEKCSDDVKQDLESKDELAKNRLIELEKLQETHQKLVSEHEKLKQQLHDIPEEMIVSSTKYKMLQTQFNLLFNDAQVIRKNCEDARKILINNHTTHLNKVEQLETENAQMKKRVRAEVGQLEKALADTRKDLEVLRIEYEHNMKAHEQIGPMAKEMRHLIKSLQNHNQQLKGEVQRYKKRLTETDAKIIELEKSSKNREEVEDTPVDYIERIDVGNRGNTSPLSESSQSSNDSSDYDDVKVLRTKLKSAREKRKEMKILLDMYKGLSKETRDKAELLKNEKTLKDEVEILKAKLIMVTDDVVRQSKKFVDEDHKKHCRKLEGKIEELQKSISNMKQEEDALLGEMEFTGQAFEEMQEQNIRLMQQLREKDDSNLKLMSERIKSTQIQKLLREEKELLTEQISTMTSRHQSTEEVMRKLEEREKVLQTTITAMEKERSFRLQADECHKRKAIEIGSQYQELVFKQENMSKQLEEVKKSVMDKSTRLEEETFKNNRIQEENVGLKKKLDRAKKMEYLGASDEILVEEVKMYKGKLTCPCCNTRPKDAILTKCFHVFCFECLKTRYDTRQRKCPKCNATFGNNDFHKIYM